jgi:hypothetical protein
MAIPATCPNCGHTGRAPEKAIGKRIACPQCGAKFQFEVFTEASREPFDTDYHREKWWKKKRGRRKGDAALFESRFV